jgi:uroporphyrin-3 C-methyltransferase
MNELPPSTSEYGAAAPGAAAPAPAPVMRREPGFIHVMQRPQSLVLLALAVLLATQAWTSHSRITSLRGDMARSLHKGNAISADTAAMVRQVREQSTQLQVKVGVLEARQSESQSQQAALEQLYQDLSKNRDDWALSEIEQVLSTASQQLQLAGNVQGALIALANADRSLSLSDKPQFIAIRRAIARDTEKLKALPAVDMAGVALRLDNVINQVDSLPLLSSEKPLLPDTRQVVAAGPAPAASPALVARLQAAWARWSGDMWNDVRQLVRVRSVDTPEALMLAPTQTYFLRENLKLRLLNARLALLARNETSFRDDLAIAQDTLAKYFDTRARATLGAQAALRQVQGNNLAIELPDLSDSLGAVRNYKAKS